MCVRGCLFVFSAFSRQVGRIHRCRERETDSDIASDRSIDRSQPIRLHYELKCHRSAKGAMKTRGQWSGQPFRARAAAFKAASPFERDPYVIVSFTILLLPLIVDVISAGGQVSMSFLYWWVYWLISLGSPSFIHDGDGDEDGDNDSIWFQSTRPWVQAIRKSPWLSERLCQK